MHKVGDEVIADDYCGVGLITKCHILSFIYYEVKFEHNTYIWFSEEKLTGLRELKLKKILCK